MKIATIVAHDRTKDTEVRHMMFETVQDALFAQMAVHNRLVEDLLRSHIRKPIKGAITAGKLKCRGLSIAKHQDHVIGLLERGELLFLDGSRRVDMRGLSEGGMAGVITAATFSAFLAVKKSMQEIFGQLETEIRFAPPSA